MVSPNNGAFSFFILAVVATTCGIFFACQKGRILTDSFYQGPADGFETTLDELASLYEKVDKLEIELGEKDQEIDAKCHEIEELVSLFQDSHDLPYSNRSNTSQRNLKQAKDDAEKAAKKATKKQAKDVGEKVAKKKKAKKNKQDKKEIKFAVRF